MCNKNVPLDLTIAEHDRGEIKCPRCGSFNVEQRWAALYVTSSKNSEERGIGNMEFNSRPAETNEPVLTGRDAARYRALLLAKRDELAVTTGEAESLVPPANDTSGDLLDWARADSEAQLQIRRRQSDAHLVCAIEDALARITRGTFGVCEVCKQPISKARLEAVPWTRVCRDCKEKPEFDVGESNRY